MKVLFGLTVDLLVLLLILCKGNLWPLFVSLVFEPGLRPIPVPEQGFRIFVSGVYPERNKSLDAIPNPLLPFSGVVSILLFFSNTLFFIGEFSLSSLVTLSMNCWM